MHIPICKMIMTLEPSQPSLPTKKQLKLIYLLLKTTLYSADSWQVTLGKIHVWTWLKNFFFFTSSWQRLQVSPILKLPSIEDDVESPWETCIYICHSLCTWQPVWAVDSRHFGTTGCEDVEKKVITTTAAKLRNFAVLLWWSLGNVEEGSSSENCCDHCRHTTLTAAILGWEIASLSISRYCAVFSKNLLQWLEHRSLSGLMSQHLFLGTGIK